jgi:small subunit ribosomal protein S17
MAKVTKAKTTKTTKQEVEETATKLQRTLSGVVVKVSDPTSVKVRVERKFPHSKYSKIVKKHKSYIAYKSPEMELEKGDFVIIGEIKPMSKRKTWEIISTEIDSK